MMAGGLIDLNKFEYNTFPEAKYVDGHVNENDMLMLYEKKLPCAAYILIDNSISVTI